MATIHYKPIMVVVACQIYSLICFAAICASDGRTYPSTCHMIAESRQMMVPRVMHTGKCPPMNEMRSMVRDICFNTLLAKILITNITLALYELPIHKPSFLTRNKEA